MGAGGLILVIKRPGSEPHSTLIPPTAEVNTDGAILPHSHTSSWRNNIKNKVVKVLNLIRRENTWRSGCIDLGTIWR
jgi:hypothetical protein